MEVKLAMRELEQKRKEDALRYEREDPASRLPPMHRQEQRRFEEAALRAGQHQGAPASTARCPLELSRYWMWCQTEAAVLLAVYIPRGGELEADIEVEVEGGRAAALRVGRRGCLPVVHRLLEGELDASVPVEVFRCAARWWRQWWWKE